MILVHEQDNRKIFLFPKSSNGTAKMYLHLNLPIYSLICM